MSHDSELRHAIELARNGQWDAAHEIVQTRSDAHACLIHAYLHRVEGDDGNAGYWYRQAGEAFPNNSIQEELERITTIVLDG